MPVILSIDHVYEWVEGKKTHYRTYATMTDGDTLQGYGKDFKVGDSVQRFFHYGIGKMRKGVAGNAPPTPKAH
jgi:hypothetical protein